jgi:hypothetical protein
MVGLNLVYLLDIDCLWWLPTPVPEDDSFDIFFNPYQLHKTAAGRAEASFEINTHSQNGFCGRSSAASVE